MLCGSGELRGAVSVLEGGYDLDSLGESALAHARALVAGGAEE